MQCSGVAEEVVGAGQPLRCVSTGACPPTSLPAYPSTRLSCLYCSPNDGGDGRAVLSLDDDIMLPCSDLERAFASWRMAPRTMVGYYPRLIEGAPLEFRGERCGGRGAAGVGSATAGSGGRRRWR